MAISGQEMNVCRILSNQSLFLKIFIEIVHSTTVQLPSIKNPLLANEHIIQFPFYTFSCKIKLSTINEYISLIQAIKALNPSIKSVPYPSDITISTKYEYERNRLCIIFYTQNNKNFTIRWRLEFQRRVLPCGAVVGWCNGSWWSWIDVNSFTFTYWLNISRFLYDFVMILAESVRNYSF